MPEISENVGSAARDFAMLERNLLSHVRIAILLMLLAGSILLGARLPSPSEPSGQTPRSAAQVPLASIQVAAALAAIASGIWEYRRGYKDMKDMKGFLEASRPHFYAMAAVSIMIFVTCIVLIADKDL